MIDFSLLYSEAFWVMIAALAAASATAYTARQASIARHVAELQISSHVYQRLTSLYDEEELVRLEHIVKSALEQNKQATFGNLSSESRSAVAKLGAFYEEVGHYIRYHKQYKKQLLSIVGRDPVRIWEILVPIIKNERMKYDPQAYQHFEHLVNQIRRTDETKNFRKEMDGIF